jgi:hypothetical protein
VSDTHRAAVEAALAEWRAAERALEETPRDAAEHAARSAKLDAAHAAYRRATLASRGRVDQLEAVAEETWERLAESGERRAQRAGGPDAA